MFPIELHVNQAGRHKLMISCFLIINRLDCHYYCFYLDYMAVPFVLNIRTWTRLNT